MNNSYSFNRSVEEKLDGFLKRQSARFPEDERLTIDLHCHDCNSNVPDELLARILGVPETWLSSDDLLQILKEHGCNTFTVTNHNNSRSCYDLLEKGYDVLVGAEFSCMVPDYKTGIHVLAYGFTPEQETRLLKLKTDIYRFQEYTAENDIPTIWAHPLYHYTTKGMPPMEFFDRMSLLFGRFEVMNGQRDSWQNILVATWIESLTEEKIRKLSKSQAIPADRFCRNPYRKSITGGSDSHMGIFTGLTGTLLHVPGLSGKTGLKKSELALQAIKSGDTAPFGSHNDSEKMAVTFLDYFCQIGINMKDPGLLRMLLHKGTGRDKLVALGITNGFMELKRHKTTLNFLKLFHDCFRGKVPGRARGFVVPKAYKKVFSLASGMAVIRRDEPEHSLPAINGAIMSIFEDLNRLLITRAEKKVTDLDAKEDFASIKIEDIINKIELPGHFRVLFDEKACPGQGPLKSINMAEFFDGLSFPFLASGVILSAYFASARAMYNSRPLLNAFAEKHGAEKQPEKTLWLTDTFEDSNGVAMVLQSMLAEIKRRDLPIDIMTASNTLSSGDHLVVLKPLTEFTLPFYEQQPVRIPCMLRLHRLFQEGEYTRIICSTEGPMGFAALYLKNAYSVPAHFYVHTDWMMFADQVLHFNEENKSRLRRILRAFYRGFDGLFVLNKDQRKWLTGRDMGFDPTKVFLTAHWADEGFMPLAPDRKHQLGVHNNGPILLFAGRLSDEKGVMDIPPVMEKVRSVFPDANMVFAGKGPRENDLKAAMPDAVFLGWVDHHSLPEIYSAADMLILPSRFDTFGCVVLESLSCGLPVTAYNTKGPKDIILDGHNGYLVKNRNEMANNIIAYLRDTKLQKSFKMESIKRARDFRPDAIITRFLNDLNSAA